MGTHSKQGFTIIETMLVLAITGTLVAALLVGVGSSIAQQRYRDSVSSFRSLIQDQYSQTDNVSNDRDATWVCGNTAKPVQSGGGSVAGQTGCLLFGRYITITGDTITTASVVGSAANQALSPPTTTIAEISANYTLGLSSMSVQTSTLEWGAQIAWPKSGAGSRNPTTPRSLSILILRSPQNGTSYTFTSDATPAIGSVTSASLKAMMIVGAVTPGQGGRVVCIDPDPTATVSVPEKLAIYIGTAANNASSIEVRSTQITKDAGGDQQC